MHEFEGDLLIGGAKLSHIHGELEHEVEAEDHDWSANDATASNWLTDEQVR
jgi:hypothetical protein